MTSILRSAFVVCVLSLTASGPAFGLGVPLDLDWEHFDWEPPRWDGKPENPSDFGNAVQFARDFGISRHLEYFDLPPAPAPDRGGKPGDVPPGDAGKPDDVPPDDSGKPDDDDDYGPPDDLPGYPGEGHEPPSDDDGIPGQAGQNGNGHIEHGNGNGYGHCSHGNGNGYGHANDDCGGQVPEPSASLLMGALLGALALVRRRSA